MSLAYGQRCQRYARQRGWTYDEHLLSIDRLTPPQRRRAMHKERHQLARFGWATWHEELRRYGTYRGAEPSLDEGAPPF